LKRFIPLLAILILLSGCAALTTLIDTFKNPLPDWTAWKCHEIILHNHNNLTIEEFRCYEKNTDGKADLDKPCLALRIKGENEPFLLAWDRDHALKNPMEKAFTALRINGEWIHGAAGKGFGAYYYPKFKEYPDMLVFVIFDEDGSEKAVLKIPIPQN